MSYTIERILNALNEEKTRATYEAVGGLRDGPGKSDSGISGFVA